MTIRNEKKKINWTKHSDQNPEITEDDFKAMVKEAEEGPFLSMF
ncbi:MAG: hypothetical protein PHE33_07200 [Bacteroidales bacterium]|nr:hypothetical protein [Bacteroidales bacterium]